MIDMVPWSEQIGALDILIAENRHRCAAPRQWILAPFPEQRTKVMPLPPTGIRESRQFDRNAKETK